MSVIFANLGASFLMLAGCAVLIYTLMRKAQADKARQRNTTVVNDMRRLPPSARPWKSEETSAEMVDLARDLNGQLTTKIIVLEQLISDSQKQIDRMEALLERMETVKKTP
jgi:hypothetical protein